MSVESFEAITLVLVLVSLRLETWLISLTGVIGLALVLRHTIENRSNEELCILIMYDIAARLSLFACIF